MIELIQKNYLDVPAEEVTLAGSTGVRVRWLIREEDGALRYAMRRFEVQSGGRIGVHSHPEEHEIYVLSGTGEIINSTGSSTIAMHGDVVYVPPHEKHGYKNRGNDPFVFLCVIPLLNK